MSSRYVVEKSGTRVVQPYIFDSPTRELLVGYHGTSKTAAKLIEEGGFQTESDSEYEWFGHGFYFFRKGICMALG